MTTVPDQKNVNSIFIGINANTKCIFKAVICSEIGQCFLSILNTKLNRIGENIPILINSYESYVQFPNGN